MIAKSLGGEMSGGQASVPGPGHSAADRSLSVKLTDDGTDIVVYSHAGDDEIVAKDYVRERAGLPPWSPTRKKDDTRAHRQSVRPRATGADSLTAVPASAPRPPTRHPELGQPTATYTYLSESGELLGYVLRFEPAGQRKQFRPLTFCGRERPEWMWRSWVAPRPLYGLERLATAPQARVIVCEGEKAAEAARILVPEAVTITSPGGAASAKSADWRPLTGRRVVIWPDNDAAGADYGRDVLEKVRSVGAADAAIIDLALLAKLRALPATCHRGGTQPMHLPKGSTRAHFRSCSSREVAARTPVPLTSRSQTSQCPRSA